MTQPQNPDPVTIRTPTDGAAARPFETDNRRALFESEPQTARSPRPTAGRALQLSRIAGSLMQNSRMG